MIVRWTHALWLAYFLFFFKIYVYSVHFKLLRDKTPEWFLGTGTHFGRYEKVRVFICMQCTYNTNFDFSNLVFIDLFYSHFLYFWLKSVLPYVYFARSLELARGCYKLSYIILYIFVSMTIIQQLHCKSYLIFITLNMIIYYILQ